MPLKPAGEFVVDTIDQGAGSAVVLVHSSASGNRQWMRLVESLSDRYRVIAVNLFGYGKTSAWPGARPLACADQAALVAASVADVPGPVGIVGHSLGAAVALEAAVQLGERTRVLIAFEPILFDDLKGHGEMEAYAEIAGVRDAFRSFAGAGDWLKVGELFIDYWAGAGAWASMPDERKARTAEMLPPVLHEFEMMFAGGTRPLEAWAAISAPVHIIHAADTRRPTATLAGMLARTYPHWTMHEVAQGGHMAPIRRPDLVNPLIARILDAASSAPTLLRHARA